MSSEFHLPRAEDRAGWCNQLIEECAELILALRKMDRFGPVATDPTTGITHNNVQQVIAEMNDVRRALAAVDRLL
jgi:hypothetical protein